MILRIVSIKFILFYIYVIQLLYLKELLGLDVPKPIEKIKLTKSYKITLQIT